MINISLPVEAEQLMPVLQEILRRAPDSTVAPLLVDSTNFRVLIGIVTATASSSTPLWVQATGGTNIQLIDNASTLGFQLQDSSARTTLNVQDNKPLLFGTNNTEKMRLTAAGLLGIGMASPAVMLDVSSTADFRNDVTVTGVFNATSTANFRSAANVTGIFNAISTANFSSDASVTGIFNATSTANFRSAANVTGVFNAISTANFSSAANVTGVFNAVSTANLSGAVNVTGAFNATSTANFSSDVTVTGTVTIQDATTQTVNGGISYDRTNKDFLIGDGTNTQLTHLGAWKTWTPTFTGFSVAPTVGLARYTQIGKLVIAIVGNSGAGTSNATTFTMTLPVNANNTVTTIGVGSGQDNGAALTNPVRIASRAASNVADLYTTYGPNNQGWTAANGKYCDVIVAYEAA